MVTVVFRTRATVSVAIKASEWLLGEEGEGFLENCRTFMSACDGWISAAEGNEGRQYGGKHTIQVLHTRLGRHDFLMVGFDWFTSEENQIDDPSNDGMGEQ